MIKKPSAPLMRFSTRDPDEFSDRISAIAPGLNCSSTSRHGVDVSICAARLPTMGMFRSALQNFRVQSPSPNFYGVTIPFSGSSDFFVQGHFDAVHHSRIHLQHPDKPFDAKMEKEPFESLQICFEKEALESIASASESDRQKATTLSELIDLRIPEARSFSRYANYLWGELTQGGALLRSPLIAAESAQMLGSLLVAAANPALRNQIEIERLCSTSAIQQAEDFLMENLLTPLAVSDIAAVAGVSTRTLSRSFRQRHGITIKEFIKARRLEVANRALLAANPAETNVTQIALNTGFDQLGRFSAAYKQAFGELPSETLNR